MFPARHAHSEVKLAAAADAAAADAAAAATAAAAVVHRFVHAQAPAGVPLQP